MCGMKGHCSPGSGAGACSALANGMNVARAGWRSIWMTCSFSQSGGVATAEAEIVMHASESWRTRVSDTRGDDMGLSDVTRAMGKRGSWVPAADVDGYDARRWEGGAFFLRGASRAQERASDIGWMERAEGLGRRGIVSGARRSDLRTQANYDPLAEIFACIIPLFRHSREGSFIDHRCSSDLERLCPGAGVAPRSDLEAGSSVLRLGGAGSAGG